MLVGAAGLVLCCAAAVTVLTQHTPGRSRPPSPGSSPAAAVTSLHADPTALAGHGELAVISAGRLSLLGGRLQRLTPVSMTGRPTALRWSPDGRYLAVTTAGTGPATSDTSISVLDATGRLQHRWSALGSSYAMAGWSARGDELALIQTGAGGADLQSLSVAAPSGTTRLVTTATSIDGAAWSPSGRLLAASVGNSSGGNWTSQLLVTQPAAGRNHTVAKTYGNVLELAGWWPDGQSLLAWRHPQGSASLAADGLPLMTFSVTGGGHQLLVPTMLTHRSWIASSPTSNEIAVIAGGDRILTSGQKTLELCQPTSCQAVPQPPGQVAFDPAYAPHGQLAFVRDAAVRPRRYGPAFNRRLDDSGGIQLLTGLTASPAPHVPSGATAPQWSDDGSLLYIRHGSVWLLAAGSRHPAAVAGPLTTDQETGYYGYLPWLQTIAWSDARATTLGPD